jgi:uncharacterized membrane protein YfcA/uncharacterized membrane protein YedE/YeeE
MFAALVLSMLAGLSLGIFGGGGSILTLPILIYALGLEPRSAIAASLLMVGTTSFVAMSTYARQRRVDWRVGLAFGAASMVGAFAGGHVAYLLPAKALLAGFTVTMLLTGAAMMRPRDERRRPVPSPRALAKTTAVGFGVGLLTGMVGTGGGFVIVPALVSVSHLTMGTAVGTSLLVIAMNSFAGLVGMEPTTIPWPLALGVTAASVVGSLIGAVLAPQVKPEALRRGFAWLVVAVATFMAAKQLPAQRIEQHMTSFTPIPALVGGALIGLSASAMLLLNGRVAGVSGILGGAVRPTENDLGWRLSFLSGLLLGGALLASFYRAVLPPAGPGVPLGLVAAAGLLVGVGTQLGNGCTSGHGVCGLSRASLRSFVATCTFIATGTLSAFFVQHVVLGLE